MKPKNVFNPQNIQAGDRVKLINPRTPDEAGEFTVSTVGGSHGNKVFCTGLGRELFATCFKLVRKAEGKTTK